MGDEDVAGSAVSGEQPLAETTRADKGLGKS